MGKEGGIPPPYITRLRFAGRGRRGRRLRRHRMKNWPRKFGNKTSGPRREGEGGGGSLPWSAGGGGKEASRAIFPSHFKGGNNFFPWWEVQKFLAVEEKGRRGKGKALSLFWHVW